MAARQLTPREIVDRVTDLATLPDLYLQLRRLLEDPNTPIGRIAELVSYDPAATARLLRFANSAMLGLSRRVDTVGRAVSVLGTQLVHDVVMAISVTRAFSAVPAPGFDLSRFWANSVFCGLAARSLAERCRILDSERLFVEGLLRDIGHLAMYHALPNEAAEAKRRSEESSRALHLVERELLGFDYAQLGAELMQAWDLPDAMVVVTRNHVEPAAGGEHRLETNLVYLASHLTDRCETGGPAGDWTLAPEVLPVWQSLELSSDDLEVLIATAARGVSEARELLVVMSAAA